MKPPAPVKLKRTREAKGEDTRIALFEAAVQVVGEEGYAGAGIAKIMARANLASGTFYNYFESRQDLFNQLLPALGERLLAHIRGRIDDSVTGIDREKQRIEAYFDFCRKTPGFLRVLNEAEVFAPEAFHKHIRRFQDGYRRSLIRSHSRGEIAGWELEEIDVLVFMLMGLRSYMTMLYQYEYIDPRKSNIESMIGIYAKLLKNGLFSK